MKIGIIGAMKVEVEKLKAEMKDTKISNIAGMEFYDGVLYNTPVTVVICGVGKVNAACCTQILIDCFNVEKIINTGIAGSLNASIDIGDIVLATDAVQHDMQVGYFGYAPGVVPGLATSEFRADELLRALAKKTCNEVNPDVHVFEGRVVSGDQFIADKKTKERLVKTFAPCCTEMEGAAIAQVCYRNEVPFLIIRAISDKADDSASMDYPVFEEQAAHHCSKLVLSLIEALS
ncbi:MAG: 5'-methylthioadenosine/adenosylhomocysteine nucleosidase [Lachnospiraceae bacterium]|nr:5'-methylthioadenosine/adenosylhomocysteine nucleosidase [Lachnospiraceae bacterium]